MAVLFCVKQVYSNLVPGPIPPPFTAWGAFTGKSELKWQPTAVKGADTVVCLHFPTPCVPFPLRWLGWDWHLSEQICLTTLAKKQYWKQGWLHIMLSARAWPQERARVSVPKGWGSTAWLLRADPAPRVLGSSPRITFAGAVLPSSDSGGKCS